MRALKTYGNWDCISIVDKILMKADYLEKRHRQNVTDIELYTHALAIAESITPLYGPYKELSNTVIELQNENREIRKLIAIKRAEICIR